MTRMAMRPTFLGLAVALAFTIGCGGGGGGSAGGTNGPDAPVDLIVQQTLPVNTQEVLNDLSDVDGVISIRFSERLAPGTVLDANNRFNGLSSDVNILDSAFARVPGTPEITGERKNILTFFPAGGVLPNGQYTITVTRDVMNFAGGRLNNGKFDHHSSFTVGSDTYAPVIRNTFPAPNQTGILKESSINITWNEELNPATVTNATVTVVDGGTNPPTPINGTLTSVRDNFEIVFTPDPATGLPPNTTIVVTILGGTSGVTDRVGNPFAGTVATPDSYQFQFSTVVEPPLPNNPPVVHPGSATIPPDAGIYVGTDKSILVLRENPFLLAVPDLTSWANGNPVPFSERLIGRPGEILVDPRWTSTADLHGWIYVVDESARNVAVVATATSQIVHRFKNLSSPRGLAVDPNGKTLYISNFGSNSVVALDLTTTAIGSFVADAALKSLDDPRSGLRVDLPVGPSPLGIAHAPDQFELFVLNTGDSTCTLINTGTNQTIKSFSVGANPVDVAVTLTFTGIGNFAFITNQGGSGDDGSVSLFWGGPGSLGPTLLLSRSAPYDIEAHLTGFKNPKGVVWGWFTDPANVWVAESGADQVTRLTLQIVSGFGPSVIPSTTAQAKVGKNPNDLTLEPWFPWIAGAAPQALITADRGSSQLSFLDATKPSRPAFVMKIPGAAFVSSANDQ